VSGGGDVSKIVNFKKVSADEANTRCLSCHEIKTHTAKFSSGVHADANVSCVSCHSIHNAQQATKLLSAKAPQLCFSCHTEIRAEFDRPYRHRVSQGLVECKDCHNEHGSFVAKELRTTGNQDAVCYKCHTEKQGPFAFEHLPVKTEGCSSCHTPHGSTNPRLLTVSQVNLLCLQCHTLTTDVASTPPSGPAHNQNQRFQACTLCHTAIHGSNFSSVFFK
jgi:DmsE family decaheme c-type cytochrome